MAKVILTDKQKKVVDDNWDKISLTELVRLVYKNSAFDGRSEEARLIKQYLGNKTVKTTVFIKAKELILTDDQKQYIQNNAVIDGKTISFVMLARNLWSNPRLTPLNLECKTVLAYLQTLPPEMSGLGIDDDVEEEYQKPDNLTKIVSKVNEYLVKDFKISELNEQQRRFFGGVMSLLQAPRFLQMMNSYTSKISRKIFEGEYIRTIFDKPDLSTDEINLCINLCWNYVQQITINRHLDMLNVRYDMVVGDPDSKMSTTLADMITAKAKELNECDTRQQKLIKDLNGSRGERNKNKIQNIVSVSTIIEWWKVEKNRKRAIELADLRKIEVGDEIDRLSNIDDLKASIFGINPSEMLNGY